MQSGTDVGDHPPITPARSATEADVGGGDAWRIYDYIARHFLASLSPDCVYQRTSAGFTAGGESFSASGVSPVRAGFTAIMPWKVQPHLNWLLAHSCSSVLSPSHQQTSCIV